ncbi:M23 family metallopeptidase [Arthrobacter sp. 1P04PC]|uniref:M23 family metallopeptidase n=1 Tax=unclassified Arthrobacter TaxID=235627 RepID=UPI00399EF21E
MRPVSSEFDITQGFGSLATGGVVGDPKGTMVQVLVSMYGDYQHDGHAGTDVGCPVGTPVRAARAGTVVLCDWDVNLPGDESWSASGYFQRFAFYKRFGGRLLVIKVAENDYDVYAHLSQWKVSYGQKVAEGQLVALSGDSSAGKDGQLGPHLHTERIVDLTYSTGGGRIFGRIDPTTVWGEGIAAMGGAVTPISQEDELSAQFEIDARGEFDKLRSFQTDVRGVLDEIKNSVKGLPALDVDLRGDLANKGRTLASLASQSAPADPDAIAKAVVDAFGGDMATLVADRLKVVVNG